MKLTKTSQEVAKMVFDAQSEQTALLGHFARLLAAARVIQNQPNAILDLRTRELGEDEFDVAVAGRVVNFRMFHDRPNQRAIVAIADASFRTSSPIVLDRFTFDALGQTDVGSGPGNTPVALSASDDCQDIVLTAVAGVIDHDATQVPIPPRPAED